ncbi:MAG: hypothetical protein WCL32_10720 [Planctomycetota bacterium]
MSALLKGIATVTPAKAIVLIVILGWIAYANTLTKAFQLDDYIWIVNNPQLRDAADNIAHFSPRPVVALSLTANALAGGASAAGYHLVNLAIHIVAALGLFGVVRRTLLLPRWQGRWDGAETSLALAAAAVWVVHPLNTHAVTYVIQRCESGMGMFYVLALYGLVRGSQAPRPLGWYLGSIAAAWGGIGCKEVMLTMIPVALFYDRVFLSKSWLEVVRRRGLYYLGLATIAAFPLRMHLMNFIAPAPVSDTSSGFNIPGLTPVQYLSTQLGVLVHYMKLAVWPRDLCFDYHDWPIAEGLRDSLAAGVVLTIVFLVCLIGALRGNAAAFLGLGVYFVLSLTSSVLPLRDVANEYRMYVPLMFLATLVVVGGYAACQRLAPGLVKKGWPLMAVVSVAIVTLTVGTILRNEDYRSAVSLWEDVLDKRPNNVRSYFYIGVGHEAAGDNAAAKENYLRRLEHAPDDNSSLLHLALIEFQEGDTRSAINRLTRSFKSMDLAIDSETFLATYLHFDGKSNDALTLLDYVKTVRPNRPAPRFHRGGILLDLGRSEDAQKEFAAGLLLAPDWPDYAKQRADERLRGALGDVPGVRREALFYAAIARAAGVQPNVDALATLADAYAWNGQNADAATTLREAIAAAAPAQRPPLEEKLKSLEKRPRQNP